jgi:hypothetical protein
MRIERMLRVRDEAKVRLADLYSLHAMCGSTSAEIHADYLATLAALPPRTPRSVRAYLEGWRACKVDSLYHTSLIFGGYVAGVFYSTHSDRPDYYSKLGISPKDFSEKATALGHYWKHNGRPFFVNEG